MPTPAQPNLGYGKATEATFDQFNQYMRSSPWYQNLIKSFGQDPNNVHLNDSQKQQVVRAAQANGAVVDEGKQEIDDSGNFRGVGHKLRNTLIVAGLAGATIATMGAAGAFSGAAAGAMGAGSAAGGAGAAGAAGAGGGLLAATTTAPLMAGTIAGGTGLAGAAGAAGLAGAAGAAGTTGLLASSATAPTMAGTIAGGTGLTGTTAATGGTLASMASKFATKQGLSDVAGAIGKANTAAGNNRLNQQELSMQANRDNTNGMSAYERSLQERAAQAEAERTQAMRDITLANDVRNPHVSQFNTRGPVTNTPEYMAAMSELEKRGMDRLNQPDQYTSAKLPAMQPFQPLPTDANGLQDRTGTKKSILESVGDYAGPAMSIYSNYFGK
jgi:hypothetical protein